MEPLSSLLRPRTLDTFVGQDHLVGEGRPLRTFIEKGIIPSMVFWGPPGCGKTTLAMIIADAVDASFFSLSGVRSKKSDLEDIIQKAEQNHLFQKPTLVFLDEIHRRNKAQQDFLLPFVEKGTIILIGATTENPSFTVNNALLSRSRVFVFESLEQEKILEALEKNIDRIRQRYNVDISQNILSKIAGIANGDLRNAFNVLESALMMTTEQELTDDIVDKACERMTYYDKDGEEHYNIISAVHKSLRDSDADAACYWIQRMLTAGEDPLYIARRMLRFASEDIGPGNNNALLIANQVYDAVHKIGMPECDVFLFHLAIYLAESKKNNAAYVVAKETRSDVEKYGNLPVPKHLRNAPTKLMKDEGYGEGYKYAHDYEDAKVDQEHFPDKLKGRKYFNTSV